MLRFQMAYFDRIDGGAVQDVGRLFFFEGKEKTHETELENLQVSVKVSYVLP